MTAPTAAPLRVRFCVTQGEDFDDAVQLVDTNGVPVDWPTGTIPRLTFSWGSSAFVLYGTVDDSWVSFHMDGATTSGIPRGASSLLDLSYSGLDGPWFPWIAGGGCA